MCAEHRPPIVRGQVAEVSWEPLRRVTHLKIKIKNKGMNKEIILKLHTHESCEPFVPCPAMPGTVHRHLMAEVIP